MGFEQTVSIPFGMWATFNIITLMVLIVSIRNHGLDIIRVGLFLSHTALITLLIIGTIYALFEIEPLIVTTPWAVWLLASIGAMGSIIITVGLFNKNG